MGDTREIAVQVNGGDEVRIRMPLEGPGRGRKLLWSKMYHFWFQAPAGGSQLPPSARAGAQAMGVLAAMLVLADWETRVCQAKRGQLGRLLAISERSVLRGQMDLEAAGIITRLQLPAGRGKGLHYLINLPPQKGDNSDILSQAKTGTDAGFSSLKHDADAGFSGVKTGTGGRLSGAKTGTGALLLYKEERDIKTTTRGGGGFENQEEIKRQEAAGKIADQFFRGENSNRKLQERAAVEAWAARMLEEFFYRDISAALANENTRWANHPAGVERYLRGNFKTRAQQEEARAAQRLRDEQALRSRQLQEEERRRFFNSEEYRRVREKIHEQAQRSKAQ
jgi:hypothetical protein